MYTEPFFLNGPNGNNSFGQPTRKGRSLYVPRLAEGHFKDLRVGEMIAFEEIDDDGKIIGFNGLKNFIRTDHGGVPVYIFDNHNHAFFFWNLAKHLGMISNAAILIHIDEHSDTREPDSYLDAIDSEDLQKIFDYTNDVLNVGNYIKPAIRSGLISEMHNIQSESQLEELEKSIYSMNRNIILNLDMDFFSEGMGYIDYNKKKRIILEVARKSSLITISTSPYFIDAEKSIEICKDIFS